MEVTVADKGGCDQDSMRTYQEEIPTYEEETPMQRPQNAAMPRRLDVWHVPCGELSLTAP